MGEGIGGNSREVSRERPEASPFKSALANQFEPHRSRRDERRGVERIKNGARMAVEGQRPRMAAKFPCAADRLFEDAAVAEMDAVEEAGCKDDRGLIYRVQCIDDAHGMIVGELVSWSVGQLAGCEGAVALEEGGDALGFGHLGREAVGGHHGAVILLVRAA